MGSQFWIKQGDLLPALRMTLRTSSGVPVSLRGANGVTFKMVSAATGVAKVNNAPGAIVDQDAGIAEYSWAGTDTDTLGEFHCEMKIQWPGGVETVPNIGFVTVFIEPHL